MVLVKETEKCFPVKIVELNTNSTTSYINP